MKNVPTRLLREHPDLDQLKRQAKDLLRGFQAGEPDAVAEVNAHYREADPKTFALHDAQLVLARSYAFQSWPKLKAYVDGVTADNFKNAVRSGDLKRVREMLTLRPELANQKLSGIDDRALHHAVAEHNLGMVRLLLEFGADPRAGMHISGYVSSEYPGALDMAVSRGYSEMVELFGGPPRSEPETAAETPSPDFAPIMQPLLQAFQRRDEAAVIAQLERHPELIHMQNPQDGMTLLHGASAFLLQDLAEWLLKRGASVKAVTNSGNTPLDVAGCGRGWDPPTPPERLMPMTELLIAHGAERTPRWAVATGNGDWLRARHAQGLLEDRRYGPEGLISLAVRWDQREIVKLLLEFGFDPDDRHRLDLEPAQDSWGEPLKFCARWGRLEMARILLDHGADPNGHIYAGGTPLFEAYDRKDAAMIELLESRNGYLDADLVGYLGLTDKARQMLADEAAGTLNPLAIPEWGVGRSVADLLIANGIGNLEMLKMVLPRIQRSREDPWWEGRLREAWGCADIDCLRILLEHCDVRACAPATLHEVAGNWPRSQRFDSADRCAKAALLLDFGAPLDARDPWQSSTPLGWACRFGRLEMVKLYLARGADPVEADAEPWAKPLAWAERNGHAEVVALLRQAMS